jgi:hypothetical protein
MSTMSRATLALLTSLAALQAEASSPNVDVIATGLNNPRGLGFSSNGDLYVAEAGTGGTGNCRPSPDGQPVEVCYGETGALTRIDMDGQRLPRRVATGLPSMAPPGGFAASSGPVDVSFRGSTAFVVMGWGGDPALRAGIGTKSRLFGTVLLVTPEGQYFPVTDVAANEQRHNPAGGPVDSNPYGILALESRRIVADAGANALIQSQTLDMLLPSRDRTFAVLPPTAFGTEAVPTSVVKGPGGYIYVGQLTGAPFFKGAATIYRVPKEGGTATPYVTGLTAVVDFAFDRGGNALHRRDRERLRPAAGRQRRSGRRQRPAAAQTEERCARSRARRARVPGRRRGRPGRRGVSQQLRNFPGRWRGSARDDRLAAKGTLTLS